MSGQWPPDRGDADDVDADAGQAAAEADVRQITAFLAELPDPVMPDAVEARISAAIAAAAADRAEAEEISGARIIGRTLKRRPGRAKVRRPRGRQRRRFGLQAITAVAACLVIAGFGFLLTRLGGSSASSSAASAPQAAPTGSTANGYVQPDSGRASFGLAEPEPSAIASPSAPSLTFAVTVLGDAYQKSTLVSQVRERIASLPDRTIAGYPGERAPSSALVGCVLHLTGDTQPSLVDEATYAGAPVYVIAVPSRAWVVGRGCTATDPELIRTVSLAGLRGNLSVLGSVEG